MKRWGLLKAAALAVSGDLLADNKKAIVSPSGFSESLHPPDSLPPGKLNIQYVRRNSPPFQVPALRGVRYLDGAPGTLDIAERARVCVKVMTAITDRKADQEVFRLTSFCQNPPVMRHDFSGWVRSEEGTTETLPLVRLASGSTENDFVDAAWMRGQLQTIGPDGLAYVPINGRPWALQSIPVAYGGTGLKCQGQKGWRRNARPKSRWLGMRRVTTWQSEAAGHLPAGPPSRNRSRWRHQFAK